jgi:hypothetical protein
MALTLSARTVPTASAMPTDDPLPDAAEAEPAAPLAPWLPLPGMLAPPLCAGADVRGAVPPPPPHAARQAHSSRVDTAHSGVHGFGEEGIDAVERIAARDAWRKRQARATRGPASFSCESART